MSVEMYARARKMATALRQNVRYKESRLISSQKFSHFDVANFRRGVLKHAPDSPKPI